MRVFENLLEGFRNVRARGWRAALTIGLLALALAANTIVFSAADSFVLHRLPYFAPDRLVEIADRDPATGTTGGPFLSAGLIDAWRRETSVFSGVEAYLTKNLFLTGDETVKTPTADITPGLVGLLGAAPRWGRALTIADAAQIDPQVVLISEGLARQRFGDPARAVGQLIRTTGRTLVVAGVMPRTFQFPVSTIRIWRAFDPRGNLAKGFGGSQSLARLAPGIPVGAATQMVERTAAELGRAAGVTRPYGATLTPLGLGRTSDTRRRLFLTLLGTAICLLLTACANVASLELAGAVRRARTCAIQMALGASRGRLIRGSLIEGALIIGGAAAVALLLAKIGADFIAVHLPDSIRAGSVNPIDLDLRAIAFMVLASAATWIVTSLPVVLYAARSSVVDLLKAEGSGTPTSPGSVTVRRVLTVAEIAAAVVLLVGSTLYARTYLALTQQDKGFDTTNVAAVSLVLPPQWHRTYAEKAELAGAILGRLKSSHTIVDGTWGSPPPGLGSRYTASVQIDGSGPATDDLVVGELDIDTGYFSTLGIPLVHGRRFEPGEPPSNVIVSQPFAERFWPGADAVGHTFRIGPSRPWLRVVGIAAHVRNESDPPGGVSTRAFQIYRAQQPPLAARPAPERVFVDNGGMYGFIDLVLRLESPARLNGALQLVRSVEPRVQVTADMLDDVYALDFSDRLMATRVIGAFGVLAFVLAAAGIYGVMTFLVTTRTREIGIRMALGADGAAIRRLVVRSSLALVIAGVAGGIALGAGLSRWTESQLYGVRTTDLATWMVVSGAVLAVAALATWQPARHAVRVDPSVLLRG